MLRKNSDNCNWWHQCYVQNLTHFTRCHFEITQRSVRGQSMKILLVLQMLFKFIQQCQTTKPLMSPKKLFLMKCVQDHNFCTQPDNMHEQDDYITTTKWLYVARKMKTLANNITKHENMKKTHGKESVIFCTQSSSFVWEDNSLGGQHKVKVSSLLLWIQDNILFKRGNNWRTQDKLGSQQNNVPKWYHANGIIIYP